VAILGEHIHFVVELGQQFFSDVGIEDLFDCHLQLEELPAVDCAEAAHGDLIADFEVCRLEGQHPVDCLSFRLDFSLGFGLIAAPAAEAGLGSGLRPEQIGFPVGRFFLILLFLLLHEPAGRFRFALPDGLDGTAILEAVAEDVLQAICEFEGEEGLELRGEGVALESEGGELGQLHDLLGQVGDGVVVEGEYLQPEELCDGGLDIGDLVIRQVQLLQGEDREDLLGDEGELPLGEVQRFLARTLGVTQLYGQLAHLNIVRIMRGCTELTERQGEDGADDGFRYFFEVFEPHRRGDARRLCAVLGWKIFAIEDSCMHYSTFPLTEATTTSRPSP
jgi:hypothetical protein